MSYQTNKIKSETMALTMNQIIEKAQERGFEFYWSGIETGNSILDGLQKAFYTHPTGDVVEVWENGYFEIYNQWGLTVNFSIN